MSKDQDQSGLSPLKEKLDELYVKVGALTVSQRLLVCLLTIAIIGAAYYYVVYVPKKDELNKAKQDYTTKNNTLSRYKKAAAELDTQEKKMADTQAQFDLAMKALPDKRELPSLLTNISQAGNDASLDIVLFKPEAEVDKVFYKEIPVAIKLQGTYHEITDFFYQINRLNRIVNINNVDVKAKKDSASLEMGCTAVTYMFVEQKEKPTTTRRTNKTKGAGKK